MNPNLFSAYLAERIVQVLLEDETLVSRLPKNSAKAVQGWISSRGLESASEEEIAKALTDACESGALIRTQGISMTVYVDLCHVLGISPRHRLRSATSRNYRDQYALLSPGRQALVRTAYYQWMENPYDPSFHFERKGHLPGNVWTARLGGLRVVADRHENLLIWKWVGDHGPYEDYLRQLHRQR